MYMYSYSEVALIHDTRHLRTRFRVDGIEAMSLGISGGKFVYSVKTARRFYFCKMYSSNFDKFLRRL